MSRSLLIDTSIFSKILRKDPHVTPTLHEELMDGSTVLVSPLVYYELRRGLLRKDSQRLMQALNDLVTRYLWIDVTRSDWDTAASLWARIVRAGRPRGDADILIAAQANNRGAVVVTNNVKHFNNLADELEDWSATPPSP